ncbi:restriction endonuclease subunit S [Shewanella oneidensis MR-1]|uniref:Type I restriction-modification system restriction endonuclease DNA specificity subunit HsdS n=1 Tax=Shewanella oneidensis (strain ATCC 700550 / JCM 31522 / CIP 106686 / LMG 19005 / NCIMB 14063 / MR-1) TaxID=211586 RepID=Q8EJT0_SHEON|nr:restriction endonuclease subunit S [Shewanella oneidensis]AAN53465.1 type I restriction-modification system restriction endonuclease DNA specificity subunit HsdS [Shewanella oneidensis MR-1]MDX5997668.1 restriction endonuclease subunit S [Shewanella oneidensis]MEE2027618.1 hypothetical protein [Shewanella oneidensis]QKG95312.1 restriction endonuclease subunit S [Shewanella oneidensis MR-1]
MSHSILSPFGKIPNDWEYQIIIDNVEFLTGPAFDSSLFNTESRGARLVRGINLTQGSTRWGEDKTKYWDVELNNLKKYQLAINDILIGMDGSLVGKNYAYLKQSDLPALLVQRVARLRAKSNLHSKYLYYMYATDFWLDYVEVVKTNSGIPHISNGDIKNFRFPFPPLPEQQKIAAILTSVDEVIEKTQAQIDKLKDLKSGMMQELLTKGVGIKQGDKYVPHIEFKDSPVGKIPKSWEVKPLNSVVLKIIDCEHKTAPYVDKSEYLVVRTSNVRHGELVLDDMKYTHADGYAEWTNRAIPSLGDVLFTREAPAGESCLVPENTKVCMGQRMVLLRPDANVIFSNFFSLFLTSEAASCAIYERSIGTTVSRINIEDIKRIPCIVPPLSEQQEISKAIQSVQNSILNKQEKLQSLKNLKKALMQDLLTGKVRVKVDNDLVV